MMCLCVIVAHLQGFELSLGYIFSFVFPGLHEEGCCDEVYGWVWEGICQVRAVTASRIPYHPPVYTSRVLCVSSISHLYSNDGL